MERKMSLKLREKVLFYQITTVAGVLFALIGFSYNVWRMEVTEENSNIRTASFEILTELSALEQLVCSAHYDHSISEGSPRKGWVKVGLILDLSVLTVPEVEASATTLKATWSYHSDRYTDEQSSVEEIVKSVDSVRKEIKRALRNLE
jgi:hypothetical protein